MIALLTTNGLKRNSILLFLFLTIFSHTYAHAEELKNFRVIIYTGDHEKGPGERVTFKLFVKDRIITSRSNWSESVFTSGTSRIKNLPNKNKDPFDSDKDCREGFFTVHKTGPGHWIASFEVLASTLDNQPVQVLRETDPLEFSLGGKNKEAMKAETIDEVDEKGKTEKLEGMSHSYPLTCKGVQPIP